jgi:hypothetical protein
MDASSVEKINRLAKNLKAMHLAATAEEAYARAKEIILGVPSEGSDRSVNELLQEADVTGKELAKARLLLQKEHDELEKLKKELGELKERRKKDSEHHSEEISDVQEVDKKLAEQEHDVGVAEENLDTAERLQED